MADNKSKRGKADRSRVSGSEGYEVNYFAIKHGITREQARDSRGSYCRPVVMST